MTMIHTTAHYLPIYVRCIEQARHECASTERQEGEEKKEAVSGKGELRSIVGRGECVESM